MRHIILIIAHDNFNHLCRLIDYFDEHFLIYIHLDKKTCFKKEEINLLREKEQVRGVYQKFYVHWGGSNILKVILFLLQRSIGETADYYHVISGVDFPIRSCMRFQLFFEQHKGHEFLEFNQLPRKEWEGGSFDRFQYYALYDWFDFRKKNGHKLILALIHFQKKYHLIRKIPNQAGKLYGGSGWFSITQNCAAYILNYTKKEPTFFRRLKHTFAPEETYFSTIILNSKFARMTINNNLRFIRWNYENGSFPANLSERHFEAIMNSHAFFARKFNTLYTQDLINQIEMNNTETANKHPFL